MKIFKNILSGMLALLAVGCNEGIDPISHVEPGEDLAAPTVTIANPNKAKIVIPFTDEKTNMDFRFEVVDDIEIKSITVALNNSNVVTYNSFLDYRKAVKSYLYNDLPVGHHSVKVTAIDMSDKTTSKTFDFEISNVYEAKYPGEVFYMPFEGGVYLDLLSKTAATAVGTPGFADGKFGKAYAGGTGEYLTFPTAGLTSEEFSATLWYKVNASPDRSGVLTMGPPDPALPATPNNRKNGFRFFREGSASSQVFKLNVGNGGSDSWFDGGGAATVSATAGWVHLAFTISDTKCVVYINGEVVKEDPFTGVDWTGCDVLSIASGAPRFMEWNHLSDASIYDEIRFFNKALTKDEVKAVMEDK
jgi:hypothetical protein